jgi:hydrogenase/urease accessory protein HupE
MMIGLCALLALHDEKVSDSEVVVSSREVVWKVEVALAGLAKKLSLPAEPTEADLRSLREPVAAILRAGLDVEVNGRPVEPEIGQIEPIWEPGLFGGAAITRVRQEFRFFAPEPVERLRIGVRLFADLTHEHRAVVTVRWDGRTRQFALLGAARLALTPDLMDPTFGRTLRQFGRWGVEHIFMGYDHLAFLLGLLVATRKLGELVKIVTSFTVAHSITLFLAAMDWVRVSPRVTESLIAASIVYVGVENFFLKEDKHRWILTFGFGLVHGLGFASVLRELMAAAAGVGVPVLSFNLGVEVGQLAIVAALFPLLVLARRGRDGKPAESRRRALTTLVSGLVVLLGAGWLVERVGGWEFMPL